MFENIDGQMDDGRTTNAGAIGILIANLGVFGSGELKKGVELMCIDKGSLE